jgi:hypothetical protein
MAGLRNRALIGTLVAGSLVFSSTGAVAAAALPTTQADPWAVLTAMNGGASAAAVCGAAVTAAAAAVQPATGCVLPQVDAVPAAQTPPPEPIPVPPVEAASGGGLGISPLLLALAAIAAGVGLYLILHHHHHSNSPA